MRPQTPSKINKTTEKKATTIHTIKVNFRVTSQVGQLTRRTSVTEPNKNSSRDESWRKAKVTPNPQNIEIRMTRGLNQISLVYAGRYLNVVKEIAFQNNIETIKTRHTKHILSQVLSSFCTFFYNLLTVWQAGWDSNPQHTDLESVALPLELPA